MPTMPTMPENNRNFYLNLLHFAAATIITCLFGMTIMLLCIVFTPHFPSFEVTSLTASSMPMNATLQQNETVLFHFEGLLENPNSLLYVWYKKLHLVLWFNSSSFATVPLDPPPLLNGVQTNIPFQVKFSVDSKNFSSGVLEEIAAQRRTLGSVNFGVTLRAWVKFKFGCISTKPRFLALNCFPLQVAFSPEYSVGNKNDTGMLVSPSQCHAD